MTPVGGRSGTPFSFRQLPPRGELCKTLRSPLPPLRGEMSRSDRGGVRRQRSDRPWDREPPLCLRHLPRKGGEGDLFRNLCKTLSPLRGEMSRSDRGGVRRQRSDRPWDREPPLCLRHLPRKGGEGNLRKGLREGGSRDRRSSWCVVGRRVGCGYARAVFVALGYGRAAAFALCGRTLCHLRRRA